MKSEKNIYSQIEELTKNTKDIQILLSCVNRTEGTLDELDKKINTDFLNESQINTVLQQGKPVCIKVEEETYFAEPFYKQERILIFGGGHLALPLVKFAKIIGYNVVVCDDRQEFANRQRFPEADEIHCGTFEQCIKKIHPAITDYCIIITRGHKEDSNCIRELFKFPEPVYTGLIGSKKRTAKLFENLIDEGLSGDRISRINTPIGLAIGAQTTEEIGISIMAEIIQRKHIESKDSLVINRSGLDIEILQILAEQKKAHAVATIMESSGSVPRNEGTKMIIYQDGSIDGTVGGGIVESKIIEKAKAIIGTNTYQIFSVSLNGKDAMAEGMLCGGMLKFLVEDGFKKQ